MKDYNNQRQVSSLVLFLILIIFIIAMCTGCATTVPVTAKWPDPPDRGGEMAMKTCPQLKSLEQEPKLSDVSRTVAINYGTYYECAVKVDTWIEWYNSQKKIFESVK